MTSQDLRKVSLTRRERLQIRLALMVHIGHSLRTIPSCMSVSSMEEISRQTQDALDAYTAMWDSVTTKDEVLQYANMQESQLRSVMEKWLYDHPETTKNNPTAATGM